MTDLLSTYYIYSHHFYQLTHSFLDIHNSLTDLTYTWTEGVCWRSALFIVYFSYISLFSILGWYTTHWCTDLLYTILTVQVSDLLMHTTLLQSLSLYYRPLLTLPSLLAHSLGLYLTHCKRLFYLEWTERYIYSTCLQLLRQALLSKWMYFLSWKPHKCYAWS